MIGDTTCCAQVIMGYVPTYGAFDVLQSQKLEYSVLVMGLVCDFGDIACSVRRGR